MIDDDNQDMEVEDILASIKSILEEDQAIAKDPEPQIASSNEVEIDDVLDLSPDMRLVPENENSNINLSAELDEIEIPHLSEEASLSDVTAASDTKETSFNISLGSEDYDSDPFYEEETNSDINIETDDIDVNPVIENGPKVEIEPVVALEPKAEPVVALKHEIEDEPVVALEPKADPVMALKHKIEDEHVVALESEKDDVSVDIINNFAKMFAQEDAPKPEVIAAPVAESIKILGDGSKTIEDVVSSVIKQIIGEEVATNWKSGLDYDVLARQEIQRQTKEWLDNNLPAVVEKIVKQEIERVMAKVGTGQ